MFDKISGNIFPWSDIVVNILTNGYLASELRKKNWEHAVTISKAFTREKENRKFSE